MPASQKTVLLAYLSLLVSPLFFSTNVIFGRAANDLAPFLLAFLRWGLAGGILLLVSRSHWPQMRRLARSQWPKLLLLGFLGMFICGGIVYFALKSTTATNGTLIYTTPPIMIIVIEHFWRGRPLRWRETIGIVLAVFGVGVIIAKGSMETIVSLQFNIGDLLFLLAAVSWAIYSVILRSDDLAELGTLPLFALVACFGALTLLPVAAYELVTALSDTSAINTSLPTTANHWMIIAGIVFLSSIIAFSTFQHGVKVLGSSIAGIFMYLLPPFGIGFAWIFLNETIQSFHVQGIAAILSGVVLATFPMRLLRKSS